jgi:hypothetical protein
MARITFVKALAAAGALTMLNLASVADTTDPFVGTWVINVAKSTFNPGPPLKSHTTKITDAGNGAIREVVDYVEGDGTATHMEFTTAIDGKEVPVTGSETGTVTVTRLSPRTVKYVFKKAGKWTETGKFTVSKSGTVMTGSLFGNDAGVAWKYHYVLDRQ